ncbi:MAG: Hsp20/alpha crystallin family protein, partial [Candidatus Saccharicenans sp.]
MKKKIRPVARVFKVETEIRGASGQLVFKREALGNLGLTWEPAVDVYEKDQEIVVEVEVPGIQARNLRVIQWGNRLEISGLKKEVVEAEKLKFHRLEREMGFFHKEVILPAYVSAEKTKAVLENGVLTIFLQKVKKENKEIEVKIQKAK